MKKIIKKIVPQKIVLFYHYILSRLASIWFNFPGKKMIIIGVTGTKGKTSTINFIWSCLNTGGFKTGIISTANIRIGGKEFLNKYHMTMPGRFTIQKLMNQMVKEKCKVCLVETTSEGLKQYRNVGVYYDIAVFTNLTPEHLSSHEGKFEKYKEAKGKMFSDLSKHNKKIDGKKIEKVIIANSDSEHSEYFLGFKANKKFTYSIDADSDYKAIEIKELSNGVEFILNKNKFKIDILGKFNIYNTLPAIIVSELFNIDKEKISKGLSNLKVIPGRMEEIYENQNFTVLVDYAHEKQSITNVLQTANAIKNNESKNIILLGAEGGGRDKSKRPIMGELCAKMADFVIVSNVDPYEDNPTEIVEDIAVSCEKFGKVREKNLFVIEDRRSGINKALNLAKKGDVVLITGKGAEQSMIIDGKKILWDDRKVVREELKKVLEEK